jgi:hypothetical protein
MVKQGGEKRVRWLALLLWVTGMIIAVSACRSGQDDLPFVETFDSPGSWSTGEDAYSIGVVADGVYDFTVLENDISRWAAAGRRFSDGFYEVEATVVDGPLDNGFGLLFRASPETGDFYLFKISADGYVWIGRYKDGAEDTTIINNHWFESFAVQQGRNVTNQLSVRAEAGNMIFYVNGQEVGRVTDNTFTEGDVGLLVQTLSGGGVRVQFDNLSVQPLE